MPKTSLLVVITLLVSAYPVFSVNARTPFSFQTSHYLHATADENATCKYVNQFLLQHHFRKIADKGSLYREIPNRYLWFSRYLTKNQLHHLPQAGFIQAHHV